MQLMTPEIEQKLKDYPLYSQDGKGDEAQVVVKYFNPVGAGTWYVLEGEKQENGDYLFFGFVELLEAEYGYFSLSELESIQIPLRMNGEIIDTVGIERDLYSELRTIGEMKY